VKVRTSEALDPTSQRAYSCRVLTQNLFPRQTRNTSPSIGSPAAVAHSQLSLSMSGESFPIKYLSSEAIPLLCLTPTGKAPSNRSLY